MPYAYYFEDVLFTEKRLGTLLIGELGLHNTSMRHVRDLAATAGRQAIETTLLVHVELLDGHRDLVLDEILQLTHTVVHDFVERERNVRVYAEHFAQRVLVLHAVHVAVEQVAHNVQKDRIVLVHRDVASLAQLERVRHRLLAVARLRTLLFGQLLCLSVDLVQSFAQDLMIAKEQIPMLVYVEQSVQIVLLKYSKHLRLLFFKTFFLNVF